MNEQLIAAGYSRYENPGAGELHKRCDYYFAKTVKDDIGKCYIIVWYVYDYSKYPQIPENKISYMPELYVAINGDHARFVTFSGYESIEAVEDEAERLWKFYGKRRMSKWEE